MTWTVIYLLNFSSFTHIFDISLVQQKLKRLDSVILNKVIVEDNIECAFPNVEIACVYLNWIELKLHNWTRGVAAYTLSRHGVHIGRLNKIWEIKIKKNNIFIATFNSLIKSV